MLRPRAVSRLSCCLVKVDSLTDPIPCKNRTNNTTTNLPVRNAPLRTPERTSLPPIAVPTPHLFPCAPKKYGFLHDAIKLGPTSPRTQKGTYNHMQISSVNTARERKFPCLGFLPHSHRPFSRESCRSLRNAESKAPIPTLQRHCVPASCWSLPGSWRHSQVL